MAANQGKTSVRPGLPGQSLAGAAAPSTNSSQGPAAFQQQQHQPHQFRNDRRKDKGQQQQQHVNMGSDIEVGGSRDRSKSPWTIDYGEQEWSRTRLTILKNYLPTQHTIIFC